MAPTAKKKKAKPPLLGTHPATALAAVAIKELIKTRKMMALLAKRRDLLIKIVKEEGCGSAHGYRSYMYHSEARSYCGYRKAADHLKLIAISEEK